MTYLALKALHVFAVTMFLGNIATGVFWKEHADRTRDPRIIAHVLAGIIASDRVFTVPGVLLITIAGVAGALAGHLPLLRTGWVFWGIVLFSLSGVVFMRWVAPLQRRMHRLMRAGAESGNPDWAEYRRLSRAWALSGGLSLLLVLVVLVLMVVKPAMRGL